jgi:Tol biopolymer transport system component
VSPNGSRIVVEVTEGGREQLWIVDLTDGTASALTLDATNNVFAAWSPDSEAVFYRSDRREGYGLYRHALDGRGGPQLVYPGSDDLMPGDVSRDGVLVFAAGEQTGRRAILTLPVAGGQAIEYLATPAREHMPAFAPNGRWIAYASDESGQSEVYIRSYPASQGTVRRVSQSGGTAPVWSRNGSELFYRSATGSMMVVPIRLGDGITLGRREELFKVEGRFRISGNAAAYDVDASGRFIMVTESGPPPFSRQINIVLNWTEELKRLVPARVPN